MYEIISIYLKKIADSQCAEKTVIWRDNAQLPQRLNSTFFEIFSSGGFPKRTWSEEKISKNIDFSL